jgi:3-phytase
MGRTRHAIAAVLAAACLPGCRTSSASDEVALAPVRATAAVADDADDPAIWINAQDPARSLILGTNKVAAPDGALYVFDLDGNVRQSIAPLDRPNNVDVEYGLATPDGLLDIAVVTERLRHRLRVFRVDAGGLTAIDGDGIPVLEGESGEAQMPMGVAAYRRPVDGTIFVVIAPKSGGRTNYLWQYRLQAESGQVVATLVRRFGNFSGTGEIEAVAVDDELGYVYYADEEYAIRKWHADPDHPEATEELAVFGRDDFVQQREGITVVGIGPRTGMIVVSDQIAGGSRLHFFPRQGRPGAPHQHNRVTTLLTRADSTDGIEATSTSVGGEFSAGLLVMMNGGGRNFHLYRWDDVHRLVGRR